MSGSIIEASKKAKKSGIAGFLQRKSMIAGIFLLIAAIAGAYYYKQRQSSDNQDSAVKINSATVKKADLQIAIEADGKIVSEDGVELSFSVSGDTLEVRQVFVKEGAKIKKGDRIASVRTDDLNYDLNKAYAGYQSVLASYNEKIAGASEKEIASAKSAIEQAKISLEQSKISLEKTKKTANDNIAKAEDDMEEAREDMEANKNDAASRDVKDAYAALVDVVKAAGISLESILVDSDEIIGVDNRVINDEFEANLGAKDASAFLSAKNTYELASYSQNELNDAIIGLSRNSRYAEIDESAKKAEKALAAFEKHLYEMQKMIDATVTSSSLSQNELDGFKAAVLANRSAVNSKITSLDSALQVIEDARENISEYAEDYSDSVKTLADAKEDAKQDIANSLASISAKELSLANAENDYADLLKPLTDSELASARSSLTTASISLDKAKNDLNKAVLISPIDGEVALLNYKAGDIILSSESKSVAVIINNDTLFVELDIEEADISKLSVGQAAEASFDALDGQEFSGELIYISQTAETSNNGIVTYLTKVALNETKDSKIREGMTASVRFITAGVADVLQIPVAAVKNVGGKPSVRLLNGEWAVVETGFTDGKSVEIKSGLRSGDKIIF